MEGQTEVVGQILAEDQAEAPLVVFQAHLTEEPAALAMRVLRLLRL